MNCGKVESTEKTPWLIYRCKLIANVALEADSTHLYRHLV